MTGGPEGRFLSPGDVSISSNPSHAQEEHLRPALAPGAIAECQWSGGVASLQLCHVGGHSPLPPQVLSSARQTPPGGDSCFALPPTELETGLRSGARGFLA